MIVQDARRDVPLRIVDAAELRQRGLDLPVGGRHELHDPACADAAACGGRQVALGHALRLEPTPVGADAEVALRVLLEDGVVPLALARGLSVARGGVERREQRARLAPRSRLRMRRGSDEHDRDEKCDAARQPAGERATAARQPSALPMISAMETKIAAMKIATATFPRCSSAGKSTCGVRRSIVRYETNISTTPMTAYSTLTAMTENCTGLVVRGSCSLKTRPPGGWFRCAALRAAFKSRDRGFRPLLPLV